MTFNRRAFLRQGLTGALGLSIRAAITGLPASFLISGRAQAVAVSPKFTILAGSAAGESMNCSSYGSFPATTGDLAARIEHPNPSEVGTATQRVINGITLDVNDVANGAELQVGAQRVHAARAYQALGQDFLNHLVGFWHQTGTNAHPEYNSVLRAHGALKGLRGNGSEELPAAIAEETADLLGTATSKPFVLNGQYTAQGLPLNNYRPTVVRDLLIGASRIPVDSGSFGTLYDMTIDQINRELKSQGTPEQKRFLDAHASTRAQARVLGDELGTLLNEIDGNDQINELKTAMALIKVKLAPVIVVRHAYSGDNHGDGQLQTETQRTLEALAGLNEYWRLVNTYGLADQVVYATLNVFGRTPTRNSRGGRDHWGRLTHGFIHGTHLTGGMVGGLVEFRNNRVQASGINSNTGTPTNADIAPEETLGAFMRTVMTAAGVPPDRCEARLPDGKTVQSIFQG